MYFCFRGSLMSSLIFCSVLWRSLTRLSVGFFLDRPLNICCRIYVDCIYISPVIARLGNGRRCESLISGGHVQSRGSERDSVRVTGRPVSTALTSTIP